MPSTWTLPLSAIITDLCIRAGIDASQIDVSEVTGTAATVQQLPTATNWGSAAGPNPGKDVFGTWLDRDGTSAWLFQFFGNGFARVDLASNNFLFQGNWFNTTGSTLTPMEREDGTPFFVQDDAGHYFFMTDGGTGWNTAGVGTFKLVKMHVAPSGGSTLGNGYLTVDATLAGSTFTPTINSVLVSLIDWKLFKSNGVNYIALQGRDATGRATGWVINADTMTFVGSTQAPAGPPTWFNMSIFTDDGSNLGQVLVSFNFTANVGSNNILFLLWAPNQGVTGTSLNAISANTTIILDGENGASFVTYTPSNNGLIFGNAENLPFSTYEWTGSMISILLIGGAVQGSKANDGQFFYSGTFDCPLSAFDVGVQGAVSGGAHGVLAVGGDTLQPTGGGSNVSRVGGILNLIDPVSCTLVQSFDITALINADTLVDPVPVNTSLNRDEHPVTSISADGVHETFICTNDYVPGQLVTVQGCTPGSLSVSNATITSASPTQFSIARAITQAPTAQSQVWATIKTPPIPTPFANMRYSQANGWVLVTYEYVGSPAYLIRLASSPGPIVSGYFLASQTDAKTALQNLMAAYFLDVVESDFKLKFVPRGQNPSVITIPEADLGLVADQAELVEETAQSQDLPREVSVMFVDPTIDWQQNKSQKHRHRRGIHTKQIATLQFPIVFTPEQARQIAEKQLYLAYLNALPFSINLWKAVYMALDPTDVIQFVYQGNTYQVRIMSDSIGVDYTCQLQTVSDDPDNYTANPAAGAAAGVPPNVPNPPAPTVLFLLDIPYLQDSDAVPDRSSTGFYWAMSSTVPTWPGGVLNSSSDATNYDALNSSADRVVYGTASGTLGAPPSLWTWDNVNTLDITMVNGTLSGSTDLDVLNGANILIVGNEVLQYVNAVQISAGVYRISRLLRGRRNTEYATTTHVASEVCFDPTTGSFHQPEPLVLIGLLRDYKGVTVGADISGVSAQPFTINGNDLKPAMPVSVTGVRDISANLTIGWTRRTRYAGDWLNNTGNVPLNEDTEAYQIDIMNGVTVVRTIIWTPGTYDSNGNPEAAYSAAQQTTDFGSPQAHVTVNIYQMSAQVGRGFPANATI